MKPFGSVFLIIGSARYAHAIESIRVPVSADHWRTLEADSMGPKGEAQFIRKEGFPQGLLVLKAGSAGLDGLTFSNGMIEYDYKPLAAVLRFHCWHRNARCHNNLHVPESIIL